MRNEAEWEAKLKEEGFRRVFVWRDAPDADYPDHTHAETTAHIVLDGEMTITSQGKTQTFRTGERFDVPANTVHSAQIGPQERTAGILPAGPLPARRRRYRRQS